MTYGCWGRAPYVSVMPAQDGYYMDGYTRTPRMVSMPFRMSMDCQYRDTDLGKADQKCDQCKRRTDGQADNGAGAPEEVGGGLHRVPGIRGVEGEGTGKEVPAGDGKPSDAAEQRRRLEQTWPGAAAYQPTEEK